MHATFLYSFLLSLAEHGSDFIAGSHSVTLQARELGGVACAGIPIFNDSIALEAAREFEVMFALVGATDAEGRLLINGGRAIAIPDLRAVRVAILDGDGEISHAQLCDSKLLQ